MEPRTPSRHDSPVQGETPSPRLVSPAGGSRTCLPSSSSRGLPTPELPDHPGLPGFVAGVCWASAGPGDSCLPLLEAGPRKAGCAAVPWQGRAWPSALSPSPARTLAAFQAKSPSSPLSSFVRGGWLYRRCLCRGRVGVTWGRSRFGGLPSAHLTPPFDSAAPTPAPRLDGHYQSNMVATRSTFSR